MKFGFLKQRDFLSEVLDYGIKGNHWKLWFLKQKDVVEYFGFELKGYCWRICVLESRSIFGTFLNKSQLSIGLDFVKLSC